MIPLTIWHIGGDGDIGPARAIIDRHKETKLVTFDARPEVGLPVCFSDREGEADFYIMRNPMASSLLRPDPARLHEQCKWDLEGGASRIDLWGDIAAVERTERVRTTTVDAYAREHGTPDVLSIDVQGAETRVFAGAQDTLSKVLAVISEVEFEPIYEGQGLFDRQMQMLRGHGFRLAHLFQPQPWHPGVPSGDGFYTVAEALWLRYGPSVDSLALDQLLKLTLIAGCFNRSSYARDLWNRSQAMLMAAGASR